MTRNTSSAIQALKQTRNASPLVALSILIWALSPLGGQASLRILSTINYTDTVIGLARYADTGPLRHIYTHLIMNPLDNRNYWQNMAGAEMLTALNQPVDVYERPMDIWGNVKVPWIDKLDPGHSGTWIDTADVRGADTYSSLIGIPIHALSPLGVKDLFIETSYLTLNCSTLRKKELYLYDPRSHEEILRISCPECPDWNNTYPYKVCAAGSSQAKRTRLATFLGLETPTTDPPRGANIIVVDIWPMSDYFRDEPGIDGWSTNCTVIEKHVEVHAQCDVKGCHSEAIRHSEKDKRPANFTAFDYWAGYALSNRTLVPFDPGDAVQYLSVSSNQTEFGGTDYDHLVSNVTEDQLSLRLGAFINSYVQIYLMCMLVRPKESSSLAWGPEYVPSEGLRLWTQSSDLQHVDYHIQGLLPTEDILHLFALTNVTTSTDIEVYQAKAVWVASLLICSLTVLCLGIFGIICESRSLAPKRFDPVIGQTFDNPDFGLDPGGTTLDVDDRLRLLGQLEIQIGDVRKDWDVGRISFAVKENVAPLKLGRFYE